jgi:hypothetical protein
LRQQRSNRDLRDGGGGNDIGQSPMPAMPKSHRANGSQQHNNQRSYSSTRDGAPFQQYAHAPQNEAIRESPPTSQVEQSDKHVDSRSGRGGIGNQPVRSSAGGTAPARKGKDVDQHGKGCGCVIM